MKITTYIVYGVWVLASIALKIMGLVNWWVATSCLWIPILVAFLLVLFFFIINDSTKFIQKQVERKNPPSCENCLFKMTKEISGEEQCLGERLGATKENNLCSNHQRFK